MFGSRDNVQKPYFGRNLTFQSSGVTLKIRSTSPKSSQLLPPPNNIYMHVRLRFNHWCGKGCIHLYRFSMLVILEIRSRSPKSALPTMYLCKFGQNPSTGSEDNAWKPYLDISKCQCDLENKVKVTKI